MPTKSLDEVVGSIREGVAGTGGRIQEAVHDVAEKIDEAIEEARYEGEHLRRKVRAELLKRWKDVDRAGRENAFVMALAALGIGVVVGYLLARRRE